MKHFKILIACAAAVAWAAGASAAAAVQSSATGMSVIPQSLRSCPGNKVVCEVEVPVVQDSKPLKCSVEGAIDLVWVNKSVLPGRKIRVVWVVKPKDPHDRRDYRFVPAKGIEFVPANPPDGSIYPPDRKDFDDGRIDSSPRRFGWVSVNENGPGRLFNYVVNVEWRERGSDPWSPCNPLDPKIINR